MKNDEESWKKECWKVTKFPTPILSKQPESVLGFYMQVSSFLRKDDLY